VRALENRLSLGGKFLFSLVLVILAMTFGTLLAVRELIEVGAERQMAEETSPSLLTFQAVSHQQNMALNRKAELLATLVFLRDGDAGAIREASQDPWQSEDCDLFVLTNASGKVIALQPKKTSAPASVVDDAIGSLLRASSVPARRDTRKSTDGGWVNGERFSQTASARVDQDLHTNRPSAGDVLVGRELDPPRVKEFARILSSDVVFRQGNRLLASSLPPFEEHEIAGLLTFQDGDSRVRLGNKTYFVSSL